MEEILEISDEVTIMRDGKKIGTWPSAELTTDLIISKMVGRDLTNRFPERTNVPGEVYMKVEGLTSPEPRSFKDVSFAYKKDFVLRDISFEARPGETVALVGHTGSGKSSIINLLFRFYDPQRGSITIDGQEVTDLPKQWLRSHMGIVLQDPYLFTGTIASNVSLGDERITRERVERALREVGADKLLSHLPQGFDEPVVEKGSTLSAGQRQLISFARALSFDPAILILDEATSNIDTETESIIQQALE
ncbi:hypothetical protein KC345_g11676, partial [Hortaea werneckii]